MSQIRQVLDDTAQPTAEPVVDGARRRRGRDGRVDEACEIPMTEPCRKVSAVPGTVRLEDRADPETHGGKLMPFAVPAARRLGEDLASAVGRPRARQCIDRKPRKVVRVQAVIPSRR